MALSPEAIDIVFFITLFIVFIKAFMIVYMGIKIRKKRGENLDIAISFMVSMAILLACLLGSRVLYMVFDFQYTRFDKLLYPEFQWWWKSAQLVVGAGLAYIVFVVDRKILGFKFKGLFAYIVFGGAILVLMYPVSTVDDFDSMSTISILPQLGMFVLFIVFVNIAVKASGRVRTTAVIIIVAFVLYTVAALAVNAGVITALEAALGMPVDVYMYIVQSVLKTAGVIMMAVGASRWGS